MPQLALQSVAVLAAHGAEVYGEGNWHTIPWKSNADHSLAHMNNLFIEDTYGLGVYDEREELLHATFRCMMALDKLIRDEYEEFGKDALDGETD